VNSTEKALVGRGLSTSLAEELRRRGLTLAKLKQLSPEELSELGIPTECHETIRSGSRPPVPDAVIFDLMYNCRSICCVCHNSNNGVIIHHIIPWSESRNHEKDNLVILCPNCHDRAHTTRELTRELPPEQLRHHKNTWLEEVRLAKTQALFTNRPYTFMDGVWDFFNRQRLLDCVNNSDIALETVPGFTQIREDDSGHTHKHYRWEGSLQLGNNSGQSFFANLLRTITEEYDWLDLRKIWTKSQFNALLKPNSFFALTAHFNFRNQNDGIRTGPGQTRIGHYQKRKIRIEFPFDAWECTSNSSHTHHLHGSWTCTAVGFVRSVEEALNGLTVNATCLSIGTGFTDYQGEIPDIALIAEARREVEADEL